MKILYAVHHLPPRYTGGAENRALRTARRMRALSMDVAMLCIEAIDRHQPARQDSVEHDVRIRRLSFDHRAFEDPLRWTYDNPFVEREVAALLEEHRPDVFHVISGYLMTAGAIRAAHHASVPIVITLTDYWFLCPRITLLRSDGSLCPQPPLDPVGCVRCDAESSRRYRWPAQAAPGVATALWHWLGDTLPATRLHADHILARRQTLHAALTSANVLICPSRFLRDKFVENGVSPDRMLLMRQGLHIPDRLPPRREQPVPVLGYSGQIKPHKGVDLLIDAAAALAARGRRFKLAVYGNPDEDRRYTEGLKRRVGQADWLEWRGTYAAGDVWEVQAGLDAMVVPSRWYENSPNVILEAQASGVPVVAADLGGMAELVRHDVDGLLFRPNDARDLERQLARFLDEPELPARLRAHAPDVKTVDYETAELLDVYRQLAARRVATEMARVR